MMVASRQRPKDLKCDIEGEDKYVSLVMSRMSR